MFTLEFVRGTFLSKFLLFIWSYHWSQSPILATAIFLQITLNDTDPPVTSRTQSEHSFTSTMAQDPNLEKSLIEIHGTWIPFQNITSSSNSSNTLLNCLLGFEDGAVCEPSDIFMMSDRVSLKVLEDQMCLPAFNKSLNISFLNVTEWVYTDYKDTVTEYVFRLSTFAISIIGLLANSITVMVIVKISKLHKPFYFSMLFLALSDIYFHILFYIQYSMQEVQLCTYIMFNRVLDIFNYSAKFNGSMNVIIMLTVRYVMFVYPLRSKLWLTNRKIFLLAGGSLVVSIGYGVLLNYSVSNIVTKFLPYLYVVDDISLLVFFFVINILFLVQRIKTANESVAAGHLKTRMIVTVIFVLSLNTFNSVFPLIRKGGLNSDILIFTDESTDKIDTTFQLATFGKLWNHIVHSVNPFLYFFSSPLVLRMCLKNFRCKD